MPRKRPDKLDHATLEGDVPKLDLDHQAWQRLEHAYGETLGEDARSAVTKICNIYFRRETISKSAAPKRAVIDLADKALAAVEPLYNFIAEGPTCPEKDAISEFEYQFDALLRATAISVWPRDLSVSPELSKVTKAETPQANQALLLSLTPDLVMRMIIELMAALRTIKAGRAFAGEEVSARLPIEDFLIAIREWAVANDLPISPFSGKGAGGKSEAGPIAVFVFALIKMFPEELQPRASRPINIAERIDKIVRTMRKEIGVSK